mgnify:CR=1 FL=1|tara:strand:- start:21 stop:1055 length:1035 start_codon:yes stop_codon:yes gene_type:complete
MFKKVRIAIIGATGYTGLDLIHLLSKHPKADLKYLCATKNLGKKINYFDNRIKKKFPKISSIKDIEWKKIDLVFLSLPNGEAQKIIKKTFYKYKKLKYIDLSADFRIQNLNIYKKNYGIDHKAKNLIKNSIYSISEFSRSKIRDFRIIANPGCYPTSIQLPLLPLIMKKVIMLNDISIDSKSGFSGAGKNFEKKFTHKNLYKSTFAYGIKNHRHVCEIDQEFSKITNKKVNFTFNPHLLPTFRGILSSIYLKSHKNMNSKKISTVLKKFYKGSKFIKILNTNTQIGSGNVLNTNNCEISVCDTRVKGRFVIFSAIDNLIKGASGQAVQNMNILFNFSEKLGLND